MKLLWPGRLTLGSLLISLVQRTCNNPEYRCVFWQADGSRPEGRVCCPAEGCTVSEYNKVFPVVYCAAAKSRSTDEIK